MRILGITNRYPRIGHEDVCTYHREMFRALARVHEVRLIVPIPWTDLLSDISRRKIAPRKYTNADGIAIEHPLFYFTPRVLQHHYGRMYLASVGKTARRTAKEFRPDVILSCWAHPDGWASVKLGQELGIPVLVKIMGSDVLVLSGDKRRLPYIREALQNADVVLAVSEDLREKVKEMGVSHDRIKKFPEGLDKSIFFPGSRDESRQHLALPPRSRIILFVGNIVMSKGVGVLIEACHQMRLAGSEFDCRIVGIGRDTPVIQKMIDKHGMGENVKLMGFQPPKVLADWYRACNFVVLPSFSEGIPNVLREAVACGRPFVATAVGGIPEISDPAFSNLVQPRDVGGLATAMMDMLDRNIEVDPAKSDRHSFSWETVADLLFKDFSPIT